MAWVVAGGLAYYLWVVPAKQRDDEQQRVREQVRATHGRPVFSASVREACAVSVLCLCPYQVQYWSTTPGGNSFGPLQAKKWAEEAAAAAASKQE